MAAETILTYLKPGFPKKGVSSGAYRTELVYIGPYSTLESASPAEGAAWGDYLGIAEDVNIEPVPGTSPMLGELSVNMTLNFEAGDSGGANGVAAEISYENDWTTVNRPLLEHPEFQPSGTYALDATDLAAVAVWQNDKSTANYAALTTNGKKYADGELIAITSFDDYAPIVRVTTSYVNGRPATSAVGQKDTPPTEADGPSGYEWVKSADRAIKAGKQNRWDKVEEWVGAKKVLVDKDTIYY